jgi:hypothetical protein
VAKALNLFSRRYNSRFEGEMQKQLNIMKIIKILSKIISYCRNNPE